MKEPQLSFKKILQPYILITIAGLLAFAPVSFMLRSLKNDVIALEYPINYFMSQCLHNGEIPYWFNTWGMGFPLQSNLTWGIFSTPQLFFSGIFNYNIYILHIEFMFFVLLAGWSMFHLLSKYIIKDKSIAQLLAISYMLSGFMVGSTQWLLYITAAAFIPLVISSLLGLLYVPTLKNSIQFSIMYVLMFTSVYAAFSIVTTYSLITFLLVWFLFFEKEKSNRNVKIKYLAVACLLTIILCFPCLYFTLEVLNHIDRGSPIESNASFFNSNYLHPASLTNLLLPLSSVKMKFPNTEATMLSSYMGLLFLLLTPLAIWRTILTKNKIAVFSIFTALLFLVISFGEITPVRNLLNILPGFSYFRNPAIFRLYFIFSTIIFIALTFQDKTFYDFFTLNKKTIVRTGWAFLILCLIIVFFNLNSLKNFSFNNSSAFIRNITYSRSVLISALLQSGFLALILLFIKLKKFRFLYSLLIFELILNTAICTPFFSVSSFSISEVNSILHSTQGFPLQKKDPENVAASFTDRNNNVWYNVNIFSKEVSTNDTYRGPLTLNNFYSDQSEYQEKQRNIIGHLLFAESNSVNDNIELLIQHPTYIKASVNFTNSSVVTLMQNFYKGWKAYYNNKEVQINKANKPGMQITIPKGNGIVEFKYKRNDILLFALLLHIIIICFLMYRLILFVRENINRKI